MLTKLKFPWLYVLELVVWAPLIASFIAITLFIGAETPGSPELQGKALPVGWEAAVSNRGNYLRGYLIENHLFVFVLLLFSLAASTVLLFFIHRAQMAQREIEAETRRIAHKIAQSVVFGTLVFSGYLLLSRVLVGVPLA